jgi:hypothetical protein
LAWGFLALDDVFQDFLDLSAAAKGGGVEKVNQNRFNRVEASSARHPTKVIVQLAFLGGHFGR